MQNFYSTVFSCFRKFEFQYNRLLYEPALTAARFSPLRSLIKERENIIHMTRRDVESAIKKHQTTTVPRGFYFILFWAQEFRWDYCSTQAVVRSSAIIPSSILTPAADN